MGVKYINPKKIGFAPASCLFSGISKIGFGFKLALIGFRVSQFGILGSLGIICWPSLPQAIILAAGGEKKGIGNRE